MNPEERISAKEALDHPWFVGNHWKMERVMDFKVAHDALETLKSYKVSTHKILIFIANAKVSQDHLQLHLISAEQLRR